MTLVGTLTIPALAEGPRRDAPAEGAAWLMARGDRALTGRAPGALALPLEPRWRFRTGGPIHSTPAVADGRVFVTSGDGSLYALEAATGLELWRFATQGAIEASPTVVQSSAGARVVVGSSDAHLYCLDAASGAPLWQYKAGIKILGAANWLADATGQPYAIVVGSYDHKLHCVALADGAPRWTHETPNYIHAQPAVDGEEIIAANGEGVVAANGEGVVAANGEGVVAANGEGVVAAGCDGALHLVDAAGTARGTIELGAYIAASAAVEDGRAWVGTYGNEFFGVDLAPASASAPAPGGNGIATGSAGTIAWRYKRASFPYFSSAALGEELVFFGGRDKRVHALARSDGAERWTFATGGKVDSSPVLCGDTLVVGSHDGTLYALDAATGTVRWRHVIGAPLPAGPAVAGGWVWIGADDGTLHAFGPAIAGSPANAVSPTNADEGGAR